MIIIIKILWYYIIARKIISSASREKIQIVWNTDHWSIEPARLTQEFKAPPHHWCCCRDAHYAVYMVVIIPISECSEYFTIPELWRIESSRSLSLGNTRRLSLLVPAAECVLRLLCDTVTLSVCAARQTVSHKSNDYNLAVSGSKLAKTKLFFENNNATIISQY
jgi:hypothetical protein